MVSHFFHGILPLSVIARMAEWLLSVCEALCEVGFVWIVLLLSEQSVFLQLLSHIMNFTYTLFCAPQSAVVFHKCFAADSECQTIIVRTAYKMAILFSYD